MATRTTESADLEGVCQNTSNGYNGLKLPGSIRDYTPLLLDSATGHLCFGHNIHSVHALMY